MRNSARMEQQRIRGRNKHRGRVLADAQPLDLHDYARMPVANPGRPTRHDLETWTVTDDWPERVPVSQAEIDVFEAWFSNLFDELFGPCR